MQETLLSARDTLILHRSLECGTERSRYRQPEKHFPLPVGKLDGKFASAIRLFVVVYGNLGVSHCSCQLLSGASVQNGC